MKKIALTVSILSILAVSLVIANQRTAGAQVPLARVETAGAQLSQPAPSWGLEAVPMAKKCTFSSDCSHGKCKQGRCGGCTFSSDCKGWGKCGSGWCGACTFSSDCKGFGTCSSGRCTKSPY